MNLLLITTDQWRWDFMDRRRVSCLRTPSLDRLRRDGMELTHGYANCPVCIPARFTWLHGLYPSQAHASLMGNGHDWPPPGRFPTMAQSLQQAGYHTALIGKLHSHAGLFHRDVAALEDETRGRGFDDVIEVCGKSIAYWYDCRWTRHLASKNLLKPYRIHLRQHDERTHGWRGGEAMSILKRQDTADGFIAQNVCDWLARPPEKPWFLHASFCSPHFPLDALPEFLEHYPEEEMPAPEGVEGEERIAGWKRRRAYYCAVIEHLDAEIGRVLDALQRSGKADQTLVVFTCDHGDMMGLRNQSNKGRPDDASARTPVIACWPGRIRAGSRSSAMVEAVDLPCTLLDAAGIDPAEALPHTPGMSYRRVLEGESDEHRPFIYSEMGGRRAWRMCRDRSTKYVLRGDGSESLFDMASDPGEFDDRSSDGDMKDRLSEMRRRLALAMMRVVAPDERIGPLPHDDWFDAELPMDLSLPPEPWDR